jgi:preprotein translocase subunit SecF
MILGVVVGTLSSLFLAAPLAYQIIKKKGEKAFDAAVTAE